MPADRSQKREARIGALIVAGLAAALLLVFFVPDLMRMAQPSMHLVALMGDAGALGKNSPVWLAGRKIGIVTAVEFRPANVDSTVRMAVHLDVAKKFTSHIRKDSYIRITTERLIGEPIVDIIPGTLAARPVEEDDTLRLPFRSSLEAVMDKAIALTDDFDSLVIHMKSIRGPAKARQDVIAHINKNLQAVTLQFHELSAGLANSPMAMLSDPKFRATLTHLSGNARQLREGFAAAAGRAHAAQSDAEPALKRLMARADTITRTLDELKLVVSQSGGGLILRAQKDSAIMKAVHGAQVQLDSLMAETKRNPLRFWF